MIPIGTTWERVVQSFSNTAYYAVTKTVRLRRGRILEIVVTVDAATTLLFESDGIEVYSMSFSGAGTLPFSFASPLCGEVSKPITVRQSGSADVWISASTANY